MDLADLELGLHRRGDERYAVELRFTQPKSDADVRLADPQITAAFNPATLRALEGDPAVYGRVLTEQLFAAPPLRSAFAQARATAETLELPLRLRLSIGPSAPELHALRWETLHDPEADRPLLTDERLRFSRYLGAADWRPVALRPRGELRAVVAAANPADLPSYGLAPIDAPGEVARARDGLGTIVSTSLVAPGQVTLPAIVSALRGGADILYLVCHGALVEGEPWLWLEDEAGGTARVGGAELAQRIRELERRPCLVVLASCKSAGDSEGEALRALGPLLAEAGVPAVLAMQGQVSQETVAAFIPVFFRELVRDGQIDRALTVARGAVRERADCWMPSLFMRLRSGRIWYVPGFADERQAFEKWPAVVRSLKRGQATPIVGATLSERTIGPPSALAARWAERYGYPLAPHHREELHDVAQYLSVYQDAAYPREKLADEIREALVQRFGDELAEGAAEADVADLLAVVGEIQRERNPLDPYKLLAEQPLPIYITAAYHSLLDEALRAAGKDPVVEFCRWRPELERLPARFDQEAPELPSVERPLVFHLFGVLSEPDSLVLTEDDYFDYMLRVARVPDLVPLAVREALADTALLFLGFRIDSWDFRVLYRSLMQQEGRARRSKYAHIAGQVAPDEDYFLQPQRARRYFERYFDTSDISIFWGSVEDFSAELVRQLAANDLPPARTVPDRTSLRRR